MAAFALSTGLPEFDYVYLMDLLKRYRCPRDKVTELLRSRELVRVKKGIYALGERHGQDVSLPVLANMIYGPSYVSKQYALAHYQLIPERVYEITSMTPNRNKRFRTPLGVFSYQVLPLGLFAVGVTREQLDGLRGFLIATREKALADLIHAERFDGVEALEGFLSEGLRIEAEGLRALRLGMLAKINERFQSPTLAQLSELVRRVR